MGAANETLLVADLGSLTVDAANRNFQPPILSFPLAALFGDEISLLGYDLERVNSAMYCTRMEHAAYGNKTWHPGKALIRLASG